MKSCLKSCAIILAVGMILTGCIDDKYDLSDIDTTVKVKVDNLVVPVNIDEITLSNVFDLKSDSKIKEIDGAYAFVEDGTFNSEDIKIPSIHIAGPNISPTRTNIALPSNLPSTSLGNQTLSFDIAGESTKFTASTGDVSESIISLSHAGCVMRLDIVIALQGLENKVGNVTISNLVLKLPKGLEIVGAGNKYNPETGLYNVGNVGGTGAQVNLGFDVTGIDFAKANVTFDAGRHYIGFSDELSLKAGDLIINGNDIKVPVSQLPTSFTLQTSYKMSDIDIESFSGRMKYTLDGFNISDVNLNNLPDILTQSGTNISIANPQIYVSLVNPLNVYSLKAQTGMEIVSYRDNKQIGTYALDSPGLFTINGIYGTQIYNYYLSPSTVTKLYPGYADATHVGYRSLSNVLSGDGVPTRLSISFTSPCVPEQDVKNLKLGISLGNVSGKYTFYAPLALNEGSSVVYTDVVDGWSSEDLDHVVIESLDVNLTISTTVPIELKLTGYPIDKNGKQINNVVIEGANIMANANNQKVTLHITGEVTGLDGIRFTAHAVAGSDEDALSPDMTIKLTDIRPVVNGYYQKEL